MNRRSHSLLGLWLSLGLAFAPGLALAADPKLEELKTAIQRRTEVRDEIIERRVAELVGESYDLDF